MNRIHFTEKFNDEYKNFKAEMLSGEKENIFKNYKKIMFYEKVGKVLVTAPDDKVEDYNTLTIEKIYNHYINSNNKILNFESEIDIKHLIDSCVIEQERIEFYEKYEKEYAEFKEAALSKSPSFIFNNAKEIYFYSTMYDWLQNNDYYYIKDRTQGKTLRDLFLHYNNTEKVHIESWRDIELFLSGIK